MEANSVGPVGYNSYTSSPPPAEEGSAQPTEGAEEQQAVAPAPAPAEEGAIQPETGEEPEHEGEEAGGRGRGVIRLLQAGHFRGVADVVLRIRFHDELVASTAADRAQAAADEAESLTQAGDQALEELLATEGVTEDQVGAVQQLKADFAQTVTDLVATFLAGDQSDLGQFAAEVRSAFEEFLSAVQSVFLHGGEETPPAIPEALESLSEAGLAALAQMEAAGSAVANLPPLSPPSGNGVAYEKFLAVYRELYGLEAGPEQPTEPTDVTA